MKILTLATGLLALALLALAPRAFAQQNPAGLAKDGTAKVTDRFVPLAPGAARLQGGLLGKRVSTSARDRLLKVDETELLDCFERRDEPHQDWQGEHVGKFLHAATLAWKETGNPDLKAKIDRVVARLIKTQEPDGYLGAYPKDKHWTSWDVWVHKYNIIGLLTYYQYTKNAEALAAATRAGDLLVKTFGDGPGQKDLNDPVVSTHQGMAAGSVLEPIVLLHRATGEPRYRAFAEYIVAHYDAPNGPKIVTTLEKEKAVNKVGNAKAYEMLSNLNGLLELYRVTGEKRYFNAARTAWQDIVDKRLYITGSASIGEFFLADHELPNGEVHKLCEVCVTVTWEQMNLHLLRLTGESKYADQIERTVYNHLFAAQSPDATMWSYYTPLEGRKPYSSATSCCVSSGPRGVALLPVTAVMATRGGGVAVNLFGAGRFDAPTKSGAVSVSMETDYPQDGRVLLTVIPARASASFPLLVRIPAWAQGATLSVNRKPVAAANVRPGTYAVLDRSWKAGDTVVLDLPVKPRLVLGEYGNEGKAAVMVGPTVLAFDTAYNPDIRLVRQVAFAVDDPATFQIKPAPGKSIAGEEVWETTGLIGADPKPVPLYLTPFITAGQDTRSRFTIWVARPGRQETAAGSGSLLYGGNVDASRRGNTEGDIADDDFTSFRVSWNLTKLDEDWYSVTLDKPVTIGRVVFAHGRSFHDGGWYDTSAPYGKPRVQVKETLDGPWKTVATLDTYPNTTSETMPALKDGDRFEATFPPVTAIAVRVIGKPASGDDPKQNFSSAAELQAFER